MVAITYAYIFKKSVLMKNIQGTNYAPHSSFYLYSLSEQLCMIHSAKYSFFILFYSLGDELKACTIWKKLS